MEIEEINDLAAEWWRDRARTGIYRSDDEFSTTEWDRAEHVDERLKGFARNRYTLARLLEALAKAAPSEGDLPFIGTWFLEDAYPALGEDVFVSLDSAALPPAIKTAIRSGFQW